MIWIGIIIGIVIGVVWQKVLLGIELRASYGVPLELKSSEDSSEQAQKISDYLKKRLRLSHKVLGSDDAYREWYDSYGKEAIEETIGPQDANGEFGSWWLSNFITLVDMCGCSLQLQEKEE